MAGRYWREAASLILVGRSPVRSFRNQKDGALNYDYNILTLKRSARSSFLPEAVVFPGGALDKADLSSSWINLFKEKGYTQNDLLKLFRFPDNSNIEMYANKISESLLPELAFRICALRETFEETGVLLAAKSADDSFSSIFPLEREERNRWRKLVHDDPSQFIKLFMHIKSVPPAQNLHEWCAWLTPTSYGGFKQRFDTAFYISFIDSEIQDVECDRQEIEALESSGPMHILNSYYNKELVLKPPQLYELSRLVRYSKLEDLKDFSEKRSSKGLQRWLPVMVYCPDGVSTLLPGDDNYPKSPNCFNEETNLQEEQTVEEYRKSYHSVNRIEMKKLQLFKLFVKNIDREKGQLLPVSFDELVFTK